MTAQDIALGHAPVRALRATYVGELGWELHVPVEYAADLYERIMAAGADLGLRNVGYRAVESLRLEKQYLAWATDIRSDNNPFEAGLAFAVRPDKPELLAGPALRKIRDDGVTPAALLVHGRPGRRDARRRAAGASRPAAWRRRCAAPASATPCSGPSSRRTCRSSWPSETDFVVDVATEKFPATRHDRPLYDPAGSRIRL